MFTFLKEIIIPAIAVAGIIAITFWKADEAISPEFRSAISKRLRRFPLAEASATWPEAFKRMFDYLFGAKHLTWSCFVKSAIVSTVAFFII